MHQWLDAETVEDLQKHGKMLEIKRELQVMVGDRIKIRSRSWIELFEVIQTLKSLNLSNSKEVSSNENSSNEIAFFENNVDYFKSVADKLIFALIELSGKERQRKLDITPFCYSNERYAKKWRNSIAKVIDPDVSKHPKAEQAMKILQELYEGMVQ